MRPRAGMGRAATSPARGGRTAAMPPRIRRMAARDAAAAARLSTQLGYPCVAAAMRRRIAVLAPRRATALLVAESAGTVVGWAQVERRTLLETGDFAELTGLVVDGARRRAGAGRALVAAAEAWARSRRLPTLRVRSNAVRRGARAFYERLGYRRVKRQNVFVRALVRGAAPLGEGDPPGRGAPPAGRARPDPGRARPSESVAGGRAPD